MQEVILGSRPARLTNGHAKARHSANSGAATAQSLGFKLFFLLPVLAPEQGGDIKSIKTHLYSDICRKRIRGACWAGLGRVFTFAVRSVKQFSFQSTPETTERLS